MNGWVELIILILFLVFSAIGSASSSKKKSASPKRDFDEAKPAKLPQSPSPWSSPESQPQPKTQEETVWGAPPSTKRETVSTYETEWDREEEQKRRQRERRLDPTDDPVVEERKPISLEDVFRDMFNLDEEEKPKQEPQPAPKPTPQPKTEKKKSKGLLGSGEIRKSETRKFQPRQKKPTYQQKQLSKPQAPILQQLAEEGRRDPLKTAVLYSEIFGRPRSVIGIPKPNRVGRF